MKYLVVDYKTEKILFETFDCYECDDWIDDNNLKIGDYYIHKFFTCRGEGCDKEGQQQSDWYGISTGIWCHKCYESDAYPYKKERYATIEHDGYGERLDDEY